MPLHWNNIKNIDAYIEWSGYDGSATMGLAKRKYACKVWADTNWQGL